jgi:hypothetical protein
MVLLSQASKAFEIVQVRIARIFNTYGPRMCIDDGRVVSNFVAQVSLFCDLYFLNLWRTAFFFFSILLSFRVTNENEL